MKQFNIFYREEDEDYIAAIPDLPHCSVFVEYPAEALHKVLQVPLYCPAIYQVA